MSGQMGENPYRGGPRYPDAPVVRLRVAFKPLLPFVVTVLICHFRVGALVEFSLLACWLLSMRWARDYGEAHGRSEQHELWVDAVAPPGPVREGDAGRAKRGI